MKLKQVFFISALVLSMALPGVAQHAQVSAVGIDPVNPDHVWVCNRDNNSVSVLEPSTGTLITEIRTGVRPRSLAFSADGTRVFVACQRGGIFHNRNFVTGFLPTDLRATVVVIDRANQVVTNVLTDVGVEPYGVQVAPNGAYFVVSGFRSGTMKFFDPVTLAPLASFQYLADVNEIPVGFTIADVDEDRDGMADLKDPRGFVIQSDSQRIYVTHNKSPWISVLDVTLDGNNQPTSVTLAAKISIDDYPFDTFGMRVTAQQPTANTPVGVQEIKSQGHPRFMEDIALSPDGSRALVPHLLHNVNHDVNFDFTTLMPNFPGDFANRVYPALTMIDAAALSFDQGVDNSNRLHHELTDPAVPAEFVPFGTGRIRANGMLTLGATGDPVPGGSVNFITDNLLPGDSVTILVGTMPLNQPMGGQGTLYVNVRRPFIAPGGQVTWTVPNLPQLLGQVVYAQAMVQNGPDTSFSTALRIPIQATAHGINKMGHRAGHPTRVLYNASGDHAVMLNRGSEDVFLYSVNGSDMQLRSVFPPRHQHVERAALDTSTPMGDVPMGMAMVPDPSTDADDALLYIINEGTRTLSTLRVNFTTGTIHLEHDQINTLAGPDIFNHSQLLGFELFEDASRAQTTGNFNNSCSSCHFEGGDDGDVWQRSVGPRSTMPVYGGTLGTGLILWKGVRLNMGETGPMFHGENGGTGIFTDAEQQALIDYHETVPFPINPNLNADSSYTADAAFGKDLYFGTNDTGLNPMFRHANCAECHPDVEDNPLAFPGPRFYTIDFLDPQLTGSDNVGNVDPDCFSLRENIVQINIRDVNTGVNIDIDGVGGPDSDRNQDGYVDLETYTPMNPDTDADFKRDDVNSYMCPCAGGLNCDVDMFRIFTRAMTHFSVPTKLGVFSTPPYFHDHSAYSLRTLLDPEAQALDAKYGDPAYPAGPNLPTFPGLQKIFNDVHDVKGHEQFVPGVSKVQNTLVSGSPAQAAADMEAILAYIKSL